MLLLHCLRRPAEAASAPGILLQPKQCTTADKRKSCAGVKGQQRHAGTGRRKARCLRNHSAASETSRKSVEAVDGAGQSTFGQGNECWIAHIHVLRNTRVCAHQTDPETRGGLAKRHSPSCGITRTESTGDLCFARPASHLTTPNPSCDPESGAAHMALPTGSSLPRSRSNPPHPTRPRVGTSCWRR